MQLEAGAVVAFGQPGGGFAAAKMALAGEAAQRAAGFFQPFYYLPAFFRFAFAAAHEMTFSDMLALRREHEEHEAGFASKRGF
jgi:hypothetical protein